MLEVEGFVNAGGRPRGRTLWSAPPAEFDFGPYRVTREVTVRTGLPRKGAGSRCQLTVVEAPSGSSVECELERVGMPLMTELRRGIAGTVDGEPFTVRRTGGLGLRRRDRVVEISGAVGLSLGYERRQTMIRRADDSTLVWTSASGGLLSLDVDLREAAVICMLVVNSVQQSSSMLRFLHFL